MHKIKRIIFYFPLILSYSLYGFADTAWVKTKEDDGILTFHKSDGTGIMQLKGVIVIDTSLDVVGGIFRDIPMHSKWVGFCKEAKILKIINDQHYIFYETLEPPWPVSKKDMVMDSIALYYNNEMAVSIISNTIADQLMPEKNEFERMKEMQVRIDFEYVAANKTGISYKLKINPSSDAPPFIINFFNQIYLFDNMQKLKELTNDQKYIKTLTNTEDSEAFKKLLKNPNIAKTTLQHRLSRYIKSADNVKFLANDPMIIKHWENNKNGFAELLFLGIHDQNYQKKALESIMSVYLKRYSLTHDDIKKLTTNPKVISIFINGNIENKLTKAFINNKKAS